MANTRKASDYLKRVANKAKDDFVNSAKESLVPHNNHLSNAFRYIRNNDRTPEPQPSASSSFDGDFKKSFSEINDSLDKIKSAVIRGNEISWRSLSAHAEANLILGKILKATQELNLNDSSSSMMPPLPGNDNKRNAKPPVAGTQASKLSRYLKIGGGALTVAGAGLEAYSEYQDSGNMKRAASVGGGALAGAIAGGTIGSFIPGLGTVVGGLAGGMIGSIGGSYAGRSAYDYMSSDNKTNELSSIKESKIESGEVLFNTRSVNINTKEFKINGIEIGELLKPRNGAGTGSVYSPTNSSTMPQGVSPNITSSQGIQSGSPNMNSNPSVTPTPNSQPGRGYAPAMGNSNYKGSGDDVEPKSGESVSKVSDYSKEGTTSTDRMAGVYDAFRAAGFSHKAAKSIVAEVGRENDFKDSGLFGHHSDPKNQQINSGMFSWQGDRRNRLLEYLSKGGHIDENGNIKRTQAALNAQAKFARHEMDTGEGIGKRNAEEAMRILQDPNSTYEDMARVLGKRVIKWRYDDPAYASGHSRRDRHHRAISSMFGKKDGGNEGVPGSEYDIEGGWFAPASGRVGSQFGDVRYNRDGSRRSHKGIDTRPETPGGDQSVHAMGKGRVSKIGDNGDVTIEHTLKNGQKISTVYRHIMPSHGMKVDDEVLGGSKIGDTLKHDPRFAAARSAGGRHLHSEIIQNGEKLDPGKVFPALGKKFEHSGVMLKGGQPFVDPNTLRALTLTELNKFNSDKYEDSPFTRGKVSRGILSSLDASDKRIPDFISHADNPVRNDTSWLQKLYPEAYSYNTQNNTAAASSKNSLWQRLFGGKSKLDNLDLPSISPSSEVTSDQILSLTNRNLPPLNDKSSAEVTNTLSQKAIEESAKETKPIVVDSGRSDKKTVIEKNSDQKDKSPTAAAPSRETLLEYFKDFA